MEIYKSMFQFTRPRGARPATVAKEIEGGAFQFTRPRGARLPIFYHILSLACKEDFREPVLFLDCLLLLSMIKYFAHAGSVLFFFREHPKGFLSTWGSRSVC